MRQPNTDNFAYGNAHIHSDGNSDGNGHIHSDGNCNGNAYAITDSNSYSNGECDRTAAGFTDAAASADTAAACGQLLLQ